jgi:hypothetical protein
MPGLWQEGLKVDLLLFPRRFPRTPDEEMPLRVARVRTQVALMAIKGALDDPEQSESSIDLALENLDKAREALLRA